MADLKPPLYFYDNDQTHDLLLIDGISTRVDIQNALLKLAAGVSYKDTIAIYPQKIKKLSGAETVTIAVPKNNGDTALFWRVYSEEADPSDFDYEFAGEGDFPQGVLEYNLEETSKDIVINLLPNPTETEKDFVVEVYNYRYTYKFVQPGENIVDRYVPNGGAYPWCNEWIDKVFEFIRPFSLSHNFYSGSGPNTSLLGLYFYNSLNFNHPDWQVLVRGDFKLPDLTDLALENTPLSVTITVPPKTRGLATWLDCSVPRYFERTHRLFVNGGATPKDFELDTTLTALWSLVLTDCAIKDGTPADYLLYENIDADLAPFQFHPDITTSYTYFEHIFISPIVLPVEYPTLSDVTMSPVSLNGAEIGLVRANNNPWGLLDGTTDRGMVATLEYVEEPESYGVRVKLVPHSDFLGSDWAGGDPNEYPNSVLSGKNELLNYPGSYFKQTEVLVEFFDGGITFRPPEWVLLGNLEAFLAANPTANRASQQRTTVTFNYNVKASFSSIVDSFPIEDLDLYLEYLSTLEDLPMADSARIKAIFAAVGGNQFAYSEGETLRVANLGYYIERIARVLGISVNPDGSIRSVRQRRVLPATGTIAAGWGLGQWELNEGGTFLGQVGGNEGEERDGYAYVQRSNVIKKSVFNDDDFEVAKGNIVLCENLMQLFESYLEDLDKGLNWQEMGGAVIPNADTTPNADGSQKFCSIEGMGTLLAEVAYMLSAMSKNTSQTFISSLVTQAITQEILQALGTPLEIKYVPAEAGDLDGEGYRTKIPFPGVAEDAPTVLQQALWILENLAQLKGALAKPADLPPAPVP